MQIWIDADSCPKVIKEILFRAAERLGIFIILVSNQPQRTSASQFVKSIVVPSGFNVADEHIIEQVHAGDLVITADIPLAAAVIEKEAFALNPRGKFYTKENIGEQLAVRNFMDEMRVSGITISGPKSFSQRDRKSFANQLDKFLAKQNK